MLHQSGLFGSPTKANRRSIIEESYSEEEDVEMSLVSFFDWTINLFAYLLCSD
jgi:kinesin family protein 20